MMDYYDVSAGDGGGGSSGIGNETKEIVDVADDYIGGAIIDFTGEM